MLARLEVGGRRGVQILHTNGSDKTAHPVASTWPQAPRQPPHLELLVLLSNYTYRLTNTVPDSELTPKLMDNHSKCLLCFIS